MDRIDVLELKACIVKKLGTEKADRYFSHFQSFIGSRLSKVELDKLVVMTIGKDNVGLHNQFVKAILTNAIKGKAPPPSLPPVHRAGKPSIKPHSPCITSEDTIPHASPSTLSNGDSLLRSPHHGRSLVARDHRGSNLGPREDHPTPDLSRPTQQLDWGAKQLSTETGSLRHPLKRARVMPQTPKANASVIDSGCQQSIKAQILPPISLETSIKSSLGVCFHGGMTDTGLRKPVLHAFPFHTLLQSGLDKEFEHSGDLPDSDLLQSLMEQSAISEGLEGVSRDGAVLLNVALDMYLKRLIKSCIDISKAKASSQSDSERIAEASSSQDKEAFANMKVHLGVNGVSLRPMAELLKRDKEQMQASLSLTDFKAAMNTCPQQLGENWPVQLEKISFRIFDQ
ncbi:hypothetical protein KP509_20G051400 [Ceratopteris richardii]|nr:hypothetical protein KP509_20G051400 [Ceratopteris richardii]